MILAAVDGQWAIGGGAAFLALVSLIRFLLGDKGANDVLHREIAGLSKALETERRDRREDNGHLNERINALTAEVKEQRSEKHKLGNELGQCQMLVGVIVALAEDCRCGVLDKVKDLMERQPAPFTSPYTHQRSDD